MAKMKKIPRIITISYKKGDLILNEIEPGFEGYYVQACYPISVGETKLPASITGRPQSVSLSIRDTLIPTGTGRVSFCRPSRGPTSTSLTFSGREVMFACSSMSVPASLTPILYNRPPSIQFYQAEVKAVDVKMFATVFGAVFIAELGDKTQIATLLFASDKDVSKLLVFAAAALALIVTSALGVLAGDAMSHYINEKQLSWIAGAVFILIGVWTLYQA